MNVSFPKTKALSRNCWTATEHLKKYKAITDGIDYDLEIRILKPDGEIRYVHTRGSAEKDDNGVIKRLIGTTQDITESKKAQAALSKSEERYRALFDNMPINTIVVDKEGKVTAFIFPEHPEEIERRLVRFL